MGISTIINISDSNWDKEIISVQPDPQLHFLQSYHNLLMNNKDGIPHMFKYSEGKSILLIPFLKKYIRDIDGVKVYDIKSVFGYTGPISNSTNILFLTKAFKKFSDYCINSNIISELIRFNPIIKNHKLLESNNNYTLISIKDYVVLDLKGDINVLKSGYKPRLRGYINKATKEYNNTVKYTTKTEVIEKFYNLYKKHMKYLKADDYYFMSDEYFHELTKLIKKNGFLVYSEIDGRMIAGLIFLRSGGVSYYVHGARNTKSKQSELVNKLLFHKAFEYEISNKVDYCMLGGGVSNSSEDSLLRFKKSFGGDIVPFYMGKRIHNYELYNKVVAIWEEENPELVDKYSAFIDKYRFKK